MSVRSAKNTAGYVALAAMLSAVIVGGKMALAAIPNVEVVTVLTAVIAYTWGLGMALPVTIVTILVQIPILGFNTWVIEYFIHFPLIAVAYSLLGKIRFSRVRVEVFVATLTAVVFTALFGVMTSIVDTVLAFSSTQGFKWVITDFWYRFAVLYARGIVFYVVHVACNLVMFSVAFVPLCRVNRSARARFEETYLSKAEVAE